MSQDLFGCIEGGGTKFVCGVADREGFVGEPVRIPTTDPATTLAACRDYFRSVPQNADRFQAFGIACFGPLDLNEQSATWGCLLATPKQGWSNVSIAGPISSAFGVPVAIDTDVNAAALAEARWGAARGVATSAYVTVGTGIGGGFVVNGQPWHGLGHPELGHFYPPRHPLDLDFAGVCPFHGPCLEGLASGPAVIQRWNRPLSELPQAHVAHEIIAFYLAHLVITLQSAMAPQRIVFGGGVMETGGLLEGVRAAVARLSGGYFPLRDGQDLIVQRSALGANAGLMGARVLAESQARRRRLHSDSQSVGNAFAEG